jgi:putative transposase
VSNNANIQLRKSTKRIALLMRLCKFRQRLSYKCSFMKKGYLLINEAYTSKTCTNCSYCHEQLGASKTYKCPRCKLILDRDLNGARNILLKGIH